MICPTCSGEIPEDSAVCPACSQVAVSGDPLARATVQTVAAQPPSALSPIQSVLLFLTCLIEVVLVLGVAYLKARLWSHGNFNPEATGYMLGALLAPLLISWLIVWLMTRKRNPPMAVAKKLSIGVLIAVGISFFSLMGEFSHLRPRSNEEINQ